MSSPEPILRPGAVVLERYVVQALLGVGGMGEVYRATHHSLGIPVAVKVLNGRGTSSPGARFEREAKLMAQVRHPNVVGILDYGFVARPGDSKLACMVLEFVQGHTLGDLMVSEGLAWRRCVDLFRQLLYGLDAIHRLGILHRDLKPLNILVADGPPEVLKIIDFGIAKPLEGGSKITQTGMMVGTPAYMAPEQMTGGDTGARSDLYSAGLILYELLTGELPMVDEWNRPDLKRRFEGPPAPPQSSRHGPIPRWFQSYCLRLLEPDPDQRFQSAGAALEPLRAGTGGGYETARPLDSDSHQDLREVARSDTDQDPTHVLEPEDEPVSSLGEGEQHWIVAGRLPSTRLSRAEDRRWLGELLAGQGRGLALGNQIWFAMLEQGPHSKSRADSIRRAIELRYGKAARAVSRGFDRPVEITTAMMTGSVPLPSELIGLIEAVSATGA